MCATTASKKRPAKQQVAFCFLPFASHLLHQISQRHTAVIDFDIRVQKHLYFEFDNLASGFFRANRRDGQESEQAHESRSARIWERRSNQ